MAGWMLTLSRHLIAILVGALFTLAMQHGVNFGDIDMGHLQETLTVAGVAVFASVYTAVEKALKVWWVAHFGESQPGESVAHAGYGTPVQK